MTSPAGTNRNTGSRSMNRLINHGHAIRSTRAFSRVTHFICFLPFVGQTEKTARPNPALASLRDARTAWPFRAPLGGRQSDVAEEMIIQIAQRSALPAPDEPGAERGSAPPQHRAERCGPCRA